VLARKPQGAPLPWSNVSGHVDRACSQHAKQMRDHKVSATRDADHESVLMRRQMPHKKAAPVRRGD
jgi:hypothetical protein